MGSVSKVLRVAAVAGCALSTTVVVTAPAHAGNYGCFVVTAQSLNVRARPYSSSEVIAVAKKGDVLEKRKLWCTWRGFWCAVRKGDIEGYADKSFMDKLSKCP